jgi:uncharacterized membrane protein
MDYFQTADSKKLLGCYQPNSLGNLPPGCKGRTLIWVDLVWSALVGAVAAAIDYCLKLYYIQGLLQEARTQTL